MELLVEGNCGVRVSVCEGEEEGRRVPPAFGNWRSVDPPILQKRQDPGKTKYYNIEGILWMYDISNENRIIDRVQLYQLDKVTEKAIL